MNLDDNRQPLTDEDLIVVECEKKKCSTKILYGCRECAHRKFSLDIPKMGQILLLENDGHWIGKVIQQYQITRGFSLSHAKFTHAEILGGGPYSVCASAPRLRTINFVREYQGRRAAIYSIGKEGNTRSTAKIAFWAASKCNLRYDLKGLLRFRIPFISAASNKFFCSEVVLWAIRKEFPTFMKSQIGKPEDCTPADLALTQSLRLEWVGVLPKIKKGKE